jgi:hypothetical protein
MNLIINQSIAVKYAPSKVWKALMDTNLNKQYFSEIIPDKKNAEARGKILDNPADKLYNIYLSPDDKEDNSGHDYKINYNLELQDGTTIINITHSNIEDQNKAILISEVWHQFLLEVKKKLDAEKDGL